MSSLSIRNLRKSFGAVEVLKSIDIEARSGEFIALVGPSGCGKSTLLAMIAGLEAVKSGEIWIGDKIVNSMAPKDRDIAMVFQSYALYPTMTVRENMAFGMDCRGVSKVDQVHAINRVAALLQIGPLLDRKPGQLSGGQRQRVAMGRALVRDPKLFLFDEPLSNLDAKLRVDMRTEIKRLHNAIRKTTVYVTHDQVEAMTLASRIVVMHKGEVQQFDEPDKVYNRPANTFVAGFMGSPSMNFIPATISRTDGSASVSFPAADGQPINLPLAGTNAQAPEGEVILGIRPEHFSRYTDEIAQRQGLGVFTAPVAVVEPTGAETMAVLNIGGKDIIGRFDPNDAPQLGENMKLSVNMQRACLFDVTTERLL
ncbi:sn-glycerol-3-phosphate ABC transporter ATP-binding protein UgpC [Rhizobium leguminosarum]|uniref:ABC transporter ATP-binding protein n=1 Tax=Rhizobium leguminosarum TaxID=384 RepID=UPI001C983FA5|nr:sn-glycerol-3-phosphate ABC transporter ATP-binding protein UgpC [Rhizobium leguminosarum]MBY5766978.1 sn-glycerol-3-phosphate ABC transporter ATP-binding protein UgpC [Rhizobium leguminosarum]